MRKVGRMFQITGSTGTLGNFTFLELVKQIIRGVGKLGKHQNLFIFMGVHAKMFKGIEFFIVARMPVFPDFNDRNNLIGIMR